MQPVREVGAGIYRIDVNHTRPGQTGCYLLTAGDSAALIDCGGGRRGTSAVLDALKTLAVAPAAVSWLLVTHAHLDHAGAAGQLMRELPQATFAAHPSALKHLLDPLAALEPASRTLYGDEFFETYYGGLAAVPAERAQELADEDTITVGNRTLQVIYTPGHAWHHVSFYDAGASFIFAGDAYGISYAAAQKERRLIVPVTPPSQFNPPAMRSSIERLYALNAATIALSHFDTLEANADAYRQMQLQALSEWEEHAALLFAEAPAQFETRMRAYLLDWLTATADADAATVRDWHAADTMLSAAGFDYYMKKITAAAKTTPA